MAFKMGDGYFKIEAKTKEEAYQVYVNALGMALKSLEAAVMLATNLEDDQTLQHLQTCCGALFKYAAKCRAEGKRMQIEDDEKDSQ